MLYRVISWHNDQSPVLTSRELYDEKLYILNFLFVITVLYKWSSQPAVRMSNICDFLLPAAVVCSGNNFEKIKLLFKVLNPQCISSTTFYNIQRLYVIPAIQEYWAAVLDSNLDASAGQDSVLLSGKDMTPSFFS